MSTVAVVVILIVVVLVIVVGAAFARTQARRRELRRRFGPEYERVVESHENTREAEQELLAREKRHEGLHIRPLDPEARERHLAEWRRVQERFVDAPGTAVTAAHHLLVQVMDERGYPAGGYEQRLADLSVEHANALDHYRKAHDISARAEADEASTEELRQAMMHYRALFTELLDTGDEFLPAGPNASTTEDRAEAEAPAETGGRDGDRDDTRAEAEQPVRAGARSGERTATTRVREDEEQSR